MTVTERTEPVDVDTIVTGEWVITLNAEREIYRDGAIAVSGGVITEVGKRAACPVSPTGITSTTRLHASAFNVVDSGYAVDSGAPGAPNQPHNPNPPHYSGQLAPHTPRWPLKHQRHRRDVGAGGYNWAALTPPQLTLLIFQTPRPAATATTVVAPNRAG